MAAVDCSGPLTDRHRVLASLALAALLAAVPLPRLSAAAHDPATSGAGMGTRVPLLLETGARLGAPGSPAGVSRLASPPTRGSVAQTALGPARSTPAGDPGGPPVGVRLVSLGRLQLDGG